MRLILITGTTLLTKPIMGLFAIFLFQMFLMKTIRIESKGALTTLQQRRVSIELKEIGTILPNSKSGEEIVKGKSKTKREILRKNCLVRKSPKIMENGKKTQKSMLTAETNLEVSAMVGVGKKSLKIMMNGKQAQNSKRMVETNLEASAMGGIEKGIKSKTYFKMDSDV